MNSAAKDTWQVATTFIGTVVGAGFASGQEVLKFFSLHGLSGVTGIIFSCVLFTLGGILILGFGHTLRSISYKELLVYTCGRRLGKVLDLLITLFLFGALGVMLAGSGTVLAQQLHVPYLVGTVLTVVLTVITVLAGIKGVVQANGIVVPFLVTGCVLVGLFSINIAGLSSTQATSTVTQLGPTASPFWVLSALLYAGYNLTLSVSVLVPLGATVQRKKALLWGGLLGGLGLGLLASLINLSILCNGTLTMGEEVPMLRLAGAIGPFFQVIYALILWAEIYTTIIGNVFGVTTRISAQFNLSDKATLGIVLLSALLLSQFGFARLVGFFYPLFGYISILFLAGLFSRPFRTDW